MQDDNIPPATKAPEAEIDIEPAPKSNGAVSIFQPARLPYHPAIETKLGIDRGQWGVLIDSVWPSAKTTDAVCLAINYCKARKLDPFKRQVHIVPMWNSQLGREVETVWPGISEVRTTASRTGEYAGADEAVFGEEITKTFEATDRKGNKVSATVTYPAWCRVTVYRIIKGVRVPFPGPRLMWTETFSGTKGLPVPNARWTRAPYQMIEKCAEAAALRKAFPEELGNDLTAEEMEGKLHEHGIVPAAWAKEPAVDGATEKASPAVSVADTTAAAGAKAEGQAQGNGTSVTTTAPAAAQDAAAKPQGGAPSDAAPAEATKAQATPAKRQRAPRKAAEKPSEPKGGGADAGQESAGPDTTTAPVNPGPVEAPATPAPAHEPPRKMDYQHPPVFGMNQFIALYGRMKDDADRQELVRINAALIRYLNTTPDAKAALDKAIPDIKAMLEKAAEKKA